MKRLFFIIILIQILLIPNAYAHGFGSKIDLPIPGYLYWFGGGAAVIASFAIISLFVRSKAHDDSYRTYNLRNVGIVDALYRNKSLLNVFKVISVSLLILTILTGVLGSQFPVKNFAPTFVWVVWWGGFIWLHILFGDSWNFVNPWKNIFELIKFDEKPLRQYPDKLKSWPAFGFFLIFAWIELVYPTPAHPQFLGNIIFVYSIIVLAGMRVFGKNKWLDNCEPFTVFFNFVSSFSATRVTSDGKILLRPIASGLLDARYRFDQLCFLILILSVVSFDGLISTLFWYDVIGIDAFGGSGRYDVIYVNTAGIIVSFLAFFSIFYSFVAISRAITKTDITTLDLAQKFVPALLPISIVYHLAHYSAYFFLNGQLIIKLISDPFGFGWDIFGTSSYEIVRTIDFILLWNYQVAVIVIGHILSVYIAHRISLRVFKDGKKSIMSQAPILLLMVGYTILGLWLLSTSSI
ncbi:MAG: hypothetical protein MK227_01295 [Nitrososphaerales archaeon]|nr:hypothetical protein [Nitrososphaerales archaeon]